MYRCRIRSDIVSTNVIVFSEHFLDGLTMVQNQLPRLKMDYKTKVTPSRRKIHKHESDVQKRKLIDCDDNSSDFEELDLSLEVTDYKVTD